MDILTGLSVPSRVGNDRDINHITRKYGWSVSTTSVKCLVRLVEHQVVCRVCALSTKCL